MHGAMIEAYRMRHSQWTIAVMPSMSAHEWTAYQEWVRDFQFGRRWERPSRRAGRNAATGSKRGAHSASAKAAPEERTEREHRGLVEISRLAIRVGK